MSINKMLRICVVFVALIAAKVSYAQRPFVLVVDAGHGGRDYGCINNKNNEKDITLDVARRFESMVTKAFGDSVDVVMTRDSDDFVSLDKRAKIANEAEGDLFVSIHVNSLDKKTKGRQYVHGASVYTVGLHKSDANLSVAMRENSVIELEEDFSETYQGFDPNSSESYIIFELTQNRNMSQSIDFASMVQNQLIKTAGRADKGVRQAGFLVLWATKMPAVLVELDFICNPAAERFLASDAGRKKCAESLFNAFCEYRRINTNN
ncbi:MAG: N-acetylmuramoyl-L-alanine amidase [Muribaculaceae bacterium]|nr:N-acetylmuramoyl-L-alanine amidase [Muribaculaceae bacterium]